MKNVTLSKIIGWIIFALLICLDAFLDITRGAEGNPLWQPFVKKYGMVSIIYVIPVAILVFYLIVKACSWLIKKVDKLPKAEELVLTTLVVIYAVYDLWVFFVDYLGFRLITNFRYMIPVLIIAGLAYALWAEHKIKKGEKISNNPPVK